MLFPRRALSLMEMLLVISILGLLIGLLVPSLAGIRAASRSAVCQSHLRQMTIAAQHYATLYDSWPVAVRYELTPDGFEQIGWDVVTNPMGDVIRPGPLWSLLDDAGSVLECPDNPGDQATGYNYNTTYLGGEAPFPQTGWDPIRAGIKPHHCHRTSTCCIFADAGRAGGTNRFMRAPMNTVEGSLSLVYAGAQAFRHNEGCNAAFLDGHVERRDSRYSGLLASEILKSTILGFPDNAFLSDDDAAYDPR